jgi:hypothetical protein
VKTIFALTTAILLISFSLSAGADQSVRGYIRQDGTYVAPYVRSSPNTYKFDNYSGQGNSNPYTGQRGYAPHESSSPSICSNPYRNPYDYNKD